MPWGASDQIQRCADFVDGHQHVQLYPQVRDGFLAAVKAHAPDAWVRQARRNQPLAQRLNSPKALFLDFLSTQFRRRASRAGIAYNRAFSGAYDYSRTPDYGALMQQFLDGMAEDGVEGVSSSHLLFKLGHPFLQLRLLQGPG